MRDTEARPLLIIETWQCAQLRHIPDLDRVIVAPRDQAPAVGAERHAADEADMAAEGAEQISGFAVPDLHGAVLARRGDPPAGAGAEGHGADVPAVSPQGSQLVPGLHVQELDRVVLAARRQTPAVRAERDVQTVPGDPRPEDAAGVLLLLQSGRVP